MSARSRKTKAATTESTTPSAPADEVGLLDPSLLSKRKQPPESIHLNLRLTGENVKFYRFLEKQSPAITDSLRIRDCIRIATFLCMRKQQNQTVMVDIDGKSEDLLDFLGTFYPQTPMDTRRRAKRPAQERAGGANTNSKS